MTEITGTKSQSSQLAEPKNEVLMSLTNLLEGDVDLSSLRSHEDEIDSLQALFEQAEQLNPKSNESTKGECTQFFDNSADNSAYLHCSVPHSEDAVLQLASSKNEMGNKRPSNYEVPAWCSELTFADLDLLNRELDELKQQVSRTQLEINNTAKRITDLISVKDALLYFSGQRLIQACRQAFEALGWSVIPSETNSSEILLADGDKVQAIVRIIGAPGLPNRTELSKLAESAIDHWMKFDTEPKCIFLTSMFTDLPPGERAREKFPSLYSDFAERKNLCLLTCMQLITIYKDVTLNNADACKIREELLSTSGVLSSHELNIIGSEDDEIRSASLVQ